MSLREALIEFHGQKHDLETALAIAIKSNLESFEKDSGISVMGIRVNLSRIYGTGQVSRVIGVGVEIDVGRIE